MDTKELRRHRLRVLIDQEFGGSQTALAGRIGRQPDYISRILGGKKNLGDDLAREIESATGKPRYWLEATDDDAPPALPGASPLKTEPVPDFAAPATVYDCLDQIDQSEYLLIPRRVVRLNTGKADIVIEEPMGPPLVYARSRLEAKGVRPEHAVVVSVAGNAMFPFVLPGEKVLIATDQTDIRAYNDLPWTERVFAVSAYGQLRLKVLQLLMDGALRVSNVNEAEHPPEVLAPDKIDAVRVIGRMVDRA